MGLFGKKKNNDTVSNEKTSIFGRKKKENEVQEAQVTRPSESLASVLFESVPAASLDIIRANEKFHVKSRSNYSMQCYLVMTLYVNDIGGLNKHMRGDQDKGQFIECINGGNIEVHVSEQDLMNGIINIIPTEKTLRSMSEFLFLADSNRFKNFVPTLVFVDNNGNMNFVAIQNATVDFDWFVRIYKGVSGLIVDDAVDAIIEEFQAGRSTVGDSQDVESVAETSENEVVSSDAVEESASEESEEQEESSIAQEVFGEDALDESVDDDYDEEESYDEEIPYDSSDEDEDEVVEQDDEKEDVQSENAQSDVETVECPNCGELMNPYERCDFCGFGFESDEQRQTYLHGNSNEPYQEEAQIVEGEEMPVESLTDAIERKFYASGLDLCISDQPFRAHYMSGNEYVPIPEDRGDGWLDNYVTQMVKNANAELKRLHESNLFLSRERYMEIMTNECEAIAKEFDIEDTSTIWSKAKNEAIQEAQNRKNGLDECVSNRRSEMQKRWDAELEEIVNSAAAAARRNYLDKHSREHENDLRNVETQLREQIDIDYQHTLKELNIKRHDEASHKLNIAVTQTILTVGEAYAKMLEEEEKRRQELMTGIYTYLDDHRKEDAARINVLDERQKQLQEAEKVQMQYEQRIAAMKAESDAVCDRMHTEIATAKKHEENMMADMNLKLDEYKDRLKESEAKYNELMERYVNIDATKDEQYKQRMAQADEDAGALREHIINLDARQGHESKLTLVVWAAVAVATFAIGTLIGANFLSTSRTSGGTYSIQLSASPSVASETDSSGSETAQNEAEEIENGTDNTGNTVIEDEQVANESAKASAAKSSN